MRLPMRENNRERNWNSVRSRMTELDCRVSWLGLGTRSHTQSLSSLFGRSCPTAKEIIQDVKRPQEHFCVSHGVKFLIFQWDSCIWRLTLRTHIEALSVLRFLNFPPVLGVLKSQWSDWHEDEVSMGEENMCIQVSLHWVKCSLPSGHSDMLFQLYSEEQCMAI